MKRRRFDPALSAQLIKDTLSKSDLSLKDFTARINSITEGHETITYTGMSNYAQGIRVPPYSWAFMLYVLAEYKDPLVFEFALSVLKLYQPETWTRK